MRQTTTRVPLIPADTADPVTREIFDRCRERSGTVKNIYRTLANAPLILRAWVAAGWRFGPDATVDIRYRELAILRVVQLARSRYEWSQHCQAGLKAGLSEDHLRGLDDWRDNNLFDEHDRAVLQMAEELNEGAVTEPTFNQLAERFPTSEIVELIVIASYYCAVVRIVESFTIEIEPETDDSVCVFL